MVTWYWEGCLSFALLRRPGQDIEISEKLFAFVRGAGSGFFYFVHFIVFH
jgi:hypothetical protein